MQGLLSGMDEMTGHVGRELLANTLGPLYTPSWGIALLFVLFLVLTLGVDMAMHWIEHALKKHNQLGALAVVHHLKVRFKRGGKAAGTGALACHCILPQRTAMRDARPLRPCSVPHAVCKTHAANQEAFRHCCAHCIRPCLQACPRLACRPTAPRSAAHPSFPLLPSPLTSR